MAMSHSSRMELIMGASMSPRWTAPQFLNDCRGSSRGLHRRMEKCRAQ
jgi:hypothetical protein